MAAASKRGVLVTNVIDAGDTAMATGVIALLLALATRLAKHEIAKAGATA